MKKTFKHFACLFMAILCFGQVWGTAYTPTVDEVIILNDVYNNDATDAGYSDHSAIAWGGTGTTGSKKAGDPANEGSATSSNVTCYSVKGNGKGKNITVSITGCSKIIVYHESHASRYLRIHSTDKSGTVLKTGSASTYYTELTLTSSTSYTLFMEGWTGSEQTDFYIYAVKLIMPEACSSPDAPTAFAKTNVTATTATFSITDAADAASYDIYCSESSTSPEGGTTPTATGLTTKTPTVTSLTAGTTYYAWVRAVCDESHKSNWVALTGSTFTTKAQYTITYNKGANGTGSISSETKTEGVAFTLSSSTFTRDGYAQTAWATSDGGDKAYELGGSYTTDAAQTFYPYWEIVCRDAIYNLTESVGSAEVKDLTATYTANTSIVLGGSDKESGSTIGRVIIKPKSGEKFKNGDVLFIAGTVGKAEKKFGIKYQDAEGNQIGEISISGSTDPLQVSGTLNLLSDQDSIFIVRADGTNSTLTTCIISRVVDCPATTYTVRLWNTTDWGETINAHVWNSDGNVTTWPGEATTFAAGWNTFEVEKGNSLLFCKADGTAQTVDITNVTADACYILTGEADGSGHLQLAADNECAARFYVAGNAELTGKNWNAAGSRLEDGSITFTNVPAGDHEFKVTNGSWNWSRGAAAFDSNNSNVTNTGNDNVGFTTTEAMNITIAYDETTNKITVQAEDYEVPIEPEYKAIVVAFGDKYYAMTTTLSNKGFTPLEVTVDDNGNVVVNSEAEKTSVLWKFNEGNNTASFQDANDKYLANKGTGTDLQLADEELTWTWNEAGYYEAVSGRTFFYKSSDNLFKNYSTGDLNKSGTSGAPTFYDADKVIVSTTAKLKFFAPVAWENVKAYTWEGTNTGDHAMTAVEAGSRWFECDLEKGVPFLIYNGTWNGANQTANLAALEGDKCYAWTAATDDEGKIIATEIASCEMNYYIAGDEALTGVADWGHKAISNNSITFNEVAAATYKFKITNGSWNWYLGGAYVDANACQNVTIENTDADGNVVFTIAAESNITIAYNPATEKISVVASAATPKEYYTKVTSTEDITAGTYLIVYESGNVAFNGGLTTLDAEGNTIAVTISEGKIEVSDEVDAAAFFLDPEIGTVKSASDKYIGVASYSIGLSQSDKIYIYKNAFSIDGDGNAVIAVDFDGNNMVLRYNTGSGQTRFRYYKGDKQAIQLYKKAEAAKANPELAFNPTAVEAIKGETFTAPALNNTHNVTIAYEASNSKATVVAETGQVTLVSTGEVTIYAVSAANDTYRESYAKYTISISEYTKVREELTTGYYYTMCLDKAVTHVRGASIWRVLSKAQNGKDIILEEVTGTLEAGRPYFFYAKDDKMEVVYTGAAVKDPVNDAYNNGLVGSFTQTLITPSETNFILYNNILYYVNSEAYVGAHRAYLDMTGVPAYNAGNSAPGRRRVTMQTNGEQVATGMDEVNVSETAVKMIIDGQLFILRGEKMYDATGRLVK